MARNAGWGNDIPEMLRNEDWNYAVFNADNQMPLGQKSYTFSIDPLAAAARR
jgi:hypothetical protein